MQNRFLNINIQTALEILREADIMNTNLKYHEYKSKIEISIGGESN